MKIKGNWISTSNYTHTHTHTHAHAHLQTDLRPIYKKWSFPGGASGKKNPPAKDADSIPGLGRAWKPTAVFLSRDSHGQEPGRLQSIESKRVRHNWSDVACTHKHKILQEIYCCDLGLGRTQKAPNRKDTFKTTWKFKMYIPQRGTNV